MTPRFKTAVFAGTFNPFTIGHQAIVERALLIFDKVIIAIGHNVNKPADPSLVKRVEAIGKVYDGNDAVEVTSYSGLTADFVRESGATASLRGIRNITDFEYERNLADVNKKILGVDTVFLAADPEHSYISSSVVRELQAFGHDTSALVPNAKYKV